MDQDLTAAIEAGHLALSTLYKHDRDDYPSYRRDVRVALSAAMPLIERAVREQVVRDLSTAPFILLKGQDWISANEAVRIARGES